MVMVLGIDPDSAAHGVATYDDGKLIRLNNFELLALFDYIVDITRQTADITAVIENVAANQFIYQRNYKESRASANKVAISVGRCMQSQIELMRMFDYLGLPYQLVKPNAKNWAKDRRLFERVTGWTGKSNEDTRSAAYFGYLAIGSRNGG